MPGNIIDRTFKLRDFLKIVVFALLTVLSFSLYSNFGVPQFKPGPVEQLQQMGDKIDTAEELMKLGKLIYEGKGGCILCHEGAGNRAPGLERIASVALERLKDPEYAGKASDAEEYLYESLVDPSAYIVEGYEVTGSGGAESPMPGAKSAIMDLTDIEIRAVIFYLQYESTHR